MSYTPPQLTPAGLILPTYEERLESLLDSYRSIFGPEAVLDPSSPDYQLLSLFARSQDDLGHLILSVFDSRNPRYAAGTALDLLLPLHGIIRLPGESDASARARFARASSAASAVSADALTDAVSAISGVRSARIYVNDTAASDVRGIPSHSLCAVVDGGGADAIAQAVYDHKAPGIGTHGSVTGEAHDAKGNPVLIRMFRPVASYITVQIALKKLTELSAETVPRIQQAVFDYLQTLGVGQELLVSTLYGIAYGAETSATPTYAVSSVRVLMDGAQYTDVLPANWNGRIRILSASQIYVNVT